jgi:hypothetical protein
MEVQKIYSENNQIYICLSEVAPIYDIFYVRVYLPTFPVSQASTFTEIYQAQPGIIIILNNSE